MQVLTFSELSKRWKISRRSIERGVKRGEFPQPMRIGGSLRFPLHAIEQFERRQSGDQDPADAAQDRLDAALASIGDKLAAMDSPPGSAAWTADVAARYRDLLGRLETLDKPGRDELLDLAHEHAVDSDHLELHCLAVRLHARAEPIAAELEERIEANRQPEQPMHWFGAFDERGWAENRRRAQAVTQARDASRVLSYLEAIFPELFGVKPSTIRDPRIGLVAPLLNRAAELGLKDELLDSLTGETSDDEPEFDTGPPCPWWLNRTAPDTGDKPPKSPKKEMASI